MDTMYDRMVAEHEAEMARLTAEVERQQERPYVVRWSAGEDARGNPMGVYWTRQYSPAVMNDWTMIGCADRFSWRAWWRFQRAELARWIAPILERWLEYGR
jgi:hypothetical protein